ncbi:MAG TPA: aspartyl/asparaginyl beta-hydroxylase domain-containing protein [Croceibacterium sp.]|nr:aspartyl/asparaginyl beta-hydroxylase domain-containing protein [Croceibacterium sp.]
MRTAAPRLPHRAWYYRLGKKARRTIDRLIARSSLIDTGPLLAEFPWMGELSRRWRAIAAEARALLPTVDEIPPLRLVSPDHGRISPDDQWRSFFLYGYGYKVEANCARCPETTRLVETIPDLNSAFFSILLPGTHIVPHRGPTKGLVTGHLGLKVPQSGRCLMRLDGRDVTWREGEWLVFDDTYRHEVWNDADEPRIVLLVQVRRPLRGLGKVAAQLFLSGIRRSPFVQEGRTNLAGWEKALRAGDTPD